MGFLLAVARDYMAGKSILSWFKASVSKGLLNRLDHPLASVSKGLLNRLDHHQDLNTVLATCQLCTPSQYHQFPSEDIQFEQINWPHFGPWNIDRQRRFNSKYWSRHLGYSDLNDLDKKEDWHKEDYCNCNGGFFCTLPLHEVQIMCENLQVKQHASSAL